LSLVQGEDGGQSPSCFFAGGSPGGALTGSGASENEGGYSHGLPPAHYHMGRLSRLVGVEASRVRTVGVAMVLALTQACKQETMRRKIRTTRGWTRSQTFTESAARAERTCRIQRSWLRRRLVISFSTLLFNFQLSSSLFLSLGFNEFFMSSL
jgi:hypothetical protein